MGGEYLPDRRDTEVEIARINIDSTTSDVTSVYAKAGKDRIRYRVVDEYNGDTLSEKRTRSSKRPLSLGELIDFFLGAWPLQEVLEMNELDRDGAQDFTRPTSEVYPQFEAAIRARIDGWYGKGIRRSDGAIACRSQSPFLPRKRREFWKCRTAATRR
jgi:hypothetical protein